MTCDIIMPAYNQSAVVPRAIAALAAQQLAAGDTLRLLLADDGSTDTTTAAAAAACRRHQLPNQVLAGSHRGAAAARNRALAAATADVVLLLGADILLRPQAVAQHLELHRRAPAQQLAGLGMVRWDPRLPPTPFMEWMVHGGPQNDFDNLLGTTTAPPEHYWFASHISAKRGLLQHHSFSESFHSYGWEDLELGRRLAAAGCTLHVLHAAIGLHHHAYSARDIFRRQAAAGRQLPQYQRLHPRAALPPARSRRGRLKQQLITKTGLQAALKGLIERTGTRYATPRLFAVAAAAEFWHGIHTSAAAQ